MAPTQEPTWFTSFQVESDDRADKDVIWIDSAELPKSARSATNAEKRSILLIGIVSIGWIVIMVIVLLVAIYLTRR